MSQKSSIQSNRLTQHVTPTPKQTKKFFNRPVFLTDLLSLASISTISFLSKQPFCFSFVFESGTDINANMNVHMLRNYLRKHFQLKNRRIKELALGLRWSYKNQ